MAHFLASAPRNARTAGPIDATAVTAHSTRRATRMRGRQAQSIRMLDGSPSADNLRAVREVDISASAQCVTGRVQRRGPLSRLALRP